MGEFFGDPGFFDSETEHAFFSLLTEERLLADAVLFDYNQSAEKLYFLQEGHLAVYKLTGFLQKMQVIALLDPGAVVGEAALLQNHVRHTQVIAIEESRLLCLEKSDFREFQKAFPAGAFRLFEHLLAIVSLRMEKTTERMARIL